MASRMLRVGTMMLCIGLLLAGCGGRRSETVKAEAELDAVTVRTGGNRAFQPLATSATTDLRTGDQLDVSASGRALLRFGDAITLEVFRDGDLALKSVPVRDSDPVVTVLLSFGALFGRVDQAAATSRVSVQTNLLEVVSTGTEFLVVSEAGSGRDWVFGFKDSVRVHSWNEPQVEWSVGAGQASWTDPSGPANEPVTLGEERWARLLAWYRSARAGSTVQDVQEAVFPDGMPGATGSAAPDCNFVLNFQDAQTDDWSKFRMPAPAGEGYVVFTLGEGQYAGAYCGGNFPLPALYGATLRMEFSSLKCQMRQVSIVSFNSVAATGAPQDNPVQMAGYGADGAQVARGSEIDTDNPAVKRLFAVRVRQPLTAVALTGSGLCIPCVSFGPLDAAPYDCSAVLR
ncbi:MAG: hypothetical protein WBV59_19345 [Anaerolineae bacterium]